MSDEIWFAYGHVLDRDQPFAGNVLDYTIHQEKWVAMRKTSENLMNVNNFFFVHMPMSLGGNRNTQKRAKAVT
jgi:hypothetical protein